MKLQDAYSSENNTVGNWVSIGYIAPGAKAASEATGTTTAFTYSGGDVDPVVTCASGTDANDAGTACEKAGEGDTKVQVPAVGGSVTGGWIATSNAKLNDCEGSSTWTIDASTANGVVAYTKKINNADPTATTVAVCAALTPQFVNIGK